MEQFDAYAPRKEPTRREQLEKEIMYLNESLRLKHADIQKTMGMIAVRTDELRRLNYMPDEEREG